MTEYPRLEPGQAAPKFNLLDQDGNSVSLADYRGKKIILYFYPAALTPACAKEAEDFNNALSTLDTEGYVVIGVSPDEPKKLLKFRQSRDLRFPLLSDPEKAIHHAYGAFGEKKLYGRTYVGVIRSTFVIDEKGKVSQALYNVKATGHVAMVLKRLGIQ